MEARRLIQRASYGPDALKVIGQAFDEAWASIEPNFGSDPVTIEVARLKLAQAILSAARANSHDAEALKRSALEAMALKP
jgi:hypothetical protein